MEHPESGDILSRLVLQSVDWVNLVALTEAGESVMVRQYRFGVGYATLETPGGMVDPGEDSLTAARRARGPSRPQSKSRRTWRPSSTPPRPRASPGHIRVELLTEDAVRAAVVDGTIRHALALSALSRVFDLWPRPFAQPNPEAG